MKLALTLVRVALLCRNSSKVSWLRITYSLIYGSNSEWLGHGVCFNGYLSQHYRYCCFVCLFYQQTHLNWKHSWTREFQGEKTNRLQRKRIWNKSICCFFGMKLNVNTPILINCKTAFLFLWFLLFFILCLFTVPYLCAPVESQVWAERRLQ